MKKENFENEDNDNSQKKKVKQNDSEKSSGKKTFGGEKYFWKDKTGKRKD